MMGHRLVKYSRKFAPMGGSPPPSLPTHHIQCGRPLAPGFVETLHASSSDDNSESTEEPMHYHDLPRVRDGALRFTSSAAPSFDAAASRFFDDTTRAIESMISLSKVMSVIWMSRTT